ncbi:hypothetical protein CBS101457_006532 [Exobasidium rhododendri]|nr:hypothetical protein CBS101457_006532 [Exobasidium rhododendri]
MESSYYPSPVWNSSFDDVDASTTLDTSIETENDSITRYNIRDGLQDHKMPTSRSSPGAPLGKKLHSMLGYFDDVGSFTSKALQLHQYEDVFSPPRISPSSQLFQQQQQTLCQKRSPTDTKMPGESPLMISKSRVPHRGGHVRQNTGFEMGIMHESDECVEGNISSPTMSTPPIQANDFGPGRRNSRSHTSQGIPTHSLHGALHSIGKDRSSTIKEIHSELEEENEKLRGQLELTRGRLDEVQERLGQLTLRLGSNDAAGIFLSPPSPNPVLNFSMPSFSIDNLFPQSTTPFVGLQGHTIPASNNVTVAPDPLSSYQRFHPQLISSENPYTPSLGYHPRSTRSSAASDNYGVRAGKPCDDGRFDRSGKANVQDTQLPADVLVAKALGPRSQDASIILQQQLKTGTSARKMAIIQAMGPHVLRLSDDKHGNFLIQRGVGVDLQVAWKLKGHFVSLSLSQFGCHVVQRVLDEESIRAEVAEELLSDQVFETLTCRNSIHVWQKILEINWTDSEIRVKIFKVINSVMKGRWAETAMQETGSIICQNIFESADVEEKKDCVSEILERLCECAANQWGVWVVQHIIEHGDSEHRTLAFNQLLSDAVMLTLSQYGQKAIMSALKSCNQHFIARYVDILCDREDSNESIGHSPCLSPTLSNSRRSVLVDISSAPQGVQIVTQLLTSVQPSQRDRIIKTVRKNSVFLKGSKAGLRVHQLCERARAFTGY